MFLQYKNVAQKKYFNDLDRGQMIQGHGTK